MLREGRLAKELGLGVGEPCTRAPQPEGQSTPVSWGRSLQGAAWLGQHVTGPSLGQEGSGDLAGPRTGFLPPQGTLSLPCPAGFDGSSNNSLPVFALFQGLFQGLALCSDLDACVDLRRGGDIAYLRPTRVGSRLASPGSPDVSSSRRSRRERFNWQDFGLRTDVASLGLEAGRAGAGAGPGPPESTQTLSSTCFQVMEGMDRAGRTHSQS